MWNFVQMAQLVKSESVFEKDTSKRKSQLPAEINVRRLLGSMPSLCRVTTLKGRSLSGKDLRFLAFIKTQDISFKNWKKRFRNKSK